MLKTSCPASTPDTLDARLDAAQQRVAALIGAVGTVRPAVRDFYASLTDEQKAALSIQAAPSRTAAKPIRGGAFSVPPLNLFYPQTAKTDNIRPTDRAYVPGQ